MSFSARLVTVGSIMGRQTPKMFSLSPAQSALAARFLSMSAARKDIDSAAK